MKAMKFIVLTFGIFSFSGAFGSELNPFEGMSNSAIFEMAIDENAEEAVSNTDRRRRRRVLCIARDRRGRRYLGQARRIRRARRVAVRKCRINSFLPRSCRVVRCRRIGRPW